ncbi:MAG: ribonuclease E/G, partial [Pirellulaceae bacterium]|nr:ribonuclease E/G [Pirellulaceae bacterium]
MIKEGIGAKGPTLSTYISIPGRYLVLMPALGRLGVSRKIEDDDDRKRLRQALLELNPPKGLGFIVRTAGVDRTKKELSRDMAYLLRLWKVLVRRVKKTSAPVDIYEESDMIIRTIRDIFTTDVDAIYVDQEDAYNRAKEFLQLVMPRHVGRLHLYEGKEPLFHRYKLETEIARIY